jgi:intraflagellar transport protein 88
MPFSFTTVDLISSPTLLSTSAAKPFHPLNPVGLGEHQTPTDVALDMENQINKLIEETAQLKRVGQIEKALDKAKEGSKKDQLLRLHRKTHSLSGDFEMETTYATWFNLASAYEANGMLDEALTAYTYLTKQRGQHLLTSCVRINMGNVYYAQSDFSSAIKMFKMALDQIRKDESSLTHKIFRSIGNSFFRLGSIRDAVKNYESVMDGAPDFQTGFNLLICHLVLGDVESIKSDFIRLVEIPQNSDGPLSDDYEFIAPNGLSMTNDSLQQELATRSKESSRYFLTAARMIAPSLDSNNWSAGYDWVCNALKERHHEDLAAQLELEQAVQRLKHKEFMGAVKTLKNLEKKGTAVKAKAATNLSFVKFLQGDIDRASKYADAALEADRYNADALVNKGNCFYVTEEYALAKELYLEAIGVQTDCAQAIFNLGLCNVQLELYEESIEAFENLHKITPNNPAVIYQVADIYDLRGQTDDSTKWFNVLSARLSSDSTILSRLGYLNSQKKQEEGLHYQLESYRHNPVDLDVISNIGAWFVQQEMYERSIYFFQQAALVQPKEIKWGKLIVFRLCISQSALI